MLAECVRFWLNGSGLEKKKPVCRNHVVVVVDPFYIVLIPSI